MKRKLLKLNIILIHNIVLIIICYVISDNIIHLLLPFSNNSAVLILMLSLFFMVYNFLMWKDLYSINYHYYLRNTFSIVIKNIIISLFAVSILAAILTIRTEFRFYSVYAYHFFCATISLLLIHASQFLWIKHLSRLGYFRKNVLVLGNPDKRLPLTSYFQDIGNTKTYSGIISHNNDGWFLKEKGREELKVLLYPDGLKSLLLKDNIGEIIIFLDDYLQKELLLDVVNLCRELAISYYLIPDLSTLPQKQPWNKTFPYIPIVERYSTSRDSLTNISIKRITDIILSTSSLILLFPLGILIAIAIKMEDHGPVFYTSKRVGKNAKLIRFFKFRTMVLNAKEIKHILLKFNERADGPLFKMKNDPRITRVGKILRKYSLDEIPQLFNVFIGSLSLIGPRPHLPEEVTEYKNTDYLRLECMPGIVCLPQISGRNTLTFREWVDLDLEYRMNWSLALDFKIMLKTIKVIMAPFLGQAESGY